MQGNGKRSCVLVLSKDSFSCLKESPVMLICPSDEVKDLCQLLKRIKQITAKNAFTYTVKAKNTIFSVQQ